MFIKNFSVKFKAGHKSKDKMVKIYVQAIINRKVYVIPTPIKVLESQFNGEKIVKHANAVQYNATLIKEKSRVEKIINDAVFNGKNITKEDFEEKKGADFEKFVNRHIELHKGKFSELRINHLKSALKFVLEFRPNVTFSDIDIEFLQEFEKHIRTGRQDATVLTKMSMVISFLNAAEKKGLIDKKQYAAYKRPTVKQKIPVYLTEQQVLDFYDVVKPLKNKAKKNTGYYFLLSCYTGYRISDCKAFNYDTSVKGSTIVLRAKKNGNIVSSPIYDPLDKILEYCKDHPFMEFEQDARETVKAICGDAGIPFPKTVKFHSGRHTFAMMWIKRGLSVDDVAELLGDSPEIARIYARIENTDLQKKMLDRIKKTDTGKK